MERRITMNKIILTLLLTTSLAASANAQNCVNPSRCAELGYRDDVGKCSGRKTLLCPFDSNKAFCIDPDGDSGFYTCDDFLEAIKEVDGVIYLSRGLECDMTGKSTSIRFAEGLKVIGTADQPKIEFINFGENKPTLTLPGRNTFENLRIVNADISVSGNDKFINIQAENISGNADVTFDGANKAVRVNTCNSGNTTTVTAGSSLEATNDFNALGEINGTLISGYVNNNCYKGQININGSLIGCNIRYSSFNGSLNSLKDCKEQKVHDSTINVPIAITTSTAQRNIINSKLYIDVSTSTTTWTTVRSIVNSNGEIFVNMHNSSVSYLLSDDTFIKGSRIAFFSEQYPEINGIWEAKDTTQEITISKKTAAELKKYFTRIGDWDGTIPDDIN